MNNLENNVTNQLQNIRHRKLIYLKPIQGGVNIVGKPKTTVWYLTLT